MNPEKDRTRVCAFFSSGPHYRKVLTQLRTTYPDAEICAFIPPRYPLEAASALADRVAVSAQDHYALRDWSALVRLVRRFRAERFDVFVVMFDSPRLAILAHLTGAKERWCYTMDGRRKPLRLSLLRQLLVLALRRLRGEWRYAQIRHLANQPVGEDTEDR